MRYQTTPESIIRACEIALQMKKSGLSDEFIAGAMKIAVRSEGVFDLMVLWAEEGDEEAVADIQELIDEDEKESRELGKKIEFKDLGGIADSIVEFKKKLRDKVDQSGGVSELARKTGMPQSSLSRFFNSASRPRRTTLHKIAGAIGLRPEEIAFDWTR
jgi:DNA-binding phage protein